jgi:hypothetical protein
VVDEQDRSHAEQYIAEARVLTSRTEFAIVCAAPIRAQPLETPPQPESDARQRGADSRIRIVGPLCRLGRTAGEWPGVHPKEIRRCHARKISSALFALA